jgi:hypothetical protein
MKKTLKTVGVKELKNNLSSYLRDVRAGSTVLITDRNDIVAELREPYGRANVAGTVNPLLLSWVEAGMVSLPAIAKEPLQISFIRNRAGTAQSILESDRKESRD